MNSLPGRFGHWYFIVGVCALASVLAGVGLIGYGLVETPATINPWPYIGGIAAIVLGFFATAVISILIKIESNNARQLGELRDLHETINKQLTRLDVLVTNSEISDLAKSLVHRDHELDSLRQTIRASVRREDWEGAYHLADEMERRFGYREEAAQIRDEIHDAKAEAITRRLNEAMALIDEHCRKSEWQLARSEVDRLLKLLPDDPRVTPMPGRLKALWEERKNGLLADWRQAVQRHDVDRAIEVLRDLDLYMTPDEAQELQDSARSVFKEKLMQLGVQFRFAVTEHRWHDALEAGAQLIREFPNSRMATEVRERLDILRERAKHQEPKAVQTGAA